MAAKAGFSISDLQQGAKKLNATEVEHRAESKASAAERDAGIEALEQVYDKHNGDLEAIFAELGSDPTKALKPHNRPKDAAEFARKYYDGFFSIVVDDSADAKSHK